MFWWKIRAAQHITALVLGLLLIGGIVLLTQANPNWPKESLQYLQHLDETLK
jgi:hypothetical protein